MKDASTSGRNCTRRDCQCNCCDKRTNKHCGWHTNGCHLNCPS
jgi:hypothetical protein